MYKNRSSYHIMPKAIGGIIEDIFQNGFQNFFGDESWGDGVTAPVNIQETEQGYELHLMAPGLKKEDFKVSVDRNVLHITYEHMEDAREQQTKWLRKEYKLQTFRRSFTLNEKVNVSGIFAKYTDGVLIVTLPKKEGGQPANQHIKVD